MDAAPRGARPCQLSDCLEEDRRLYVIANCGWAWVFPPESSHRDREAIKLTRNGSRQMLRYSTAYLLLDLAVGAMINAIQE